jgi:hypothetical protein
MASIVSDNALILPRRVAALKSIDAVRRKLAITASGKTLLAASFAILGAFIAWSMQELISLGE